MLQELCVSANQFFFLRLSSSARGRQCTNGAANYRSGTRATPSAEDSPSGSATACADRGVSQSAVPAPAPAPAPASINLSSLGDSRCGHFTQ
jgi:hypothetical protein